MDRKVQAAIEIGATFLSGNDLAFYRRVWGTDLEVYRARLNAIKFVDLENVLDAGCGMGQWTLCLASLNKHVCAIDHASTRVQAVQRLMQDIGITNVEVNQDFVEALDYPDQYFDGIFCYSVLMVTDYRKALQNFHRLLKPGGKIYISNSGLGWYISNLIAPYNPAQDYDPRRMAQEAIENTLLFFAENNRLQGRQLVIPSRVLKKEMETVGFKDVMAGGEGTVKLDSSVPTQSFFPAQQYGLESVYEVLAWRNVE